MQWIKRISRGLRNRERFKNAIYFHIGDLDLYPNASASPTQNPDEPYKQVDEVIRSPCNTSSNGLG